MTVSSSHSTPRSGAKTRRSESRRDQQDQGFSLVLLLAGATVAGSTFAQTLSPSLPPWVIIMFRSSLQLLVSVCLLLILRSNPLGPPGTRWQVLLMGLLSS